MTAAPALRASCTLSDPTPPAAPETTTVSPGCGARPGLRRRPSTRRRTTIQLPPRRRRRAVHELGGLDLDQLGLAGPLIGPPQDLVAGGESGHVLAGLIDHARQVAALPGGKCGRPPLGIEPFPDGRLAGVDASRLYPHHGMARAGHR